MPFSLELQIAAQHFYILFAGIIRFITSRPLYVMTRAALSGERQAHALRNIAVRDFEAYGRVLEVGQKRGDYWEYLQTHRWHRDKRVTAQDFSSAQEGYFDTVLLFNANTSNELLSRARKALRSGGVLIGDSHDNPQSLLVGNGFSRVQIIPLRGMGFVYRGEVA
jgi:hypothetical protein